MDEEWDNSANQARGSRKNPADFGFSGVEALLKEQKKLLTELLQVAPNGMLM